MDKGRSNETPGGRLPSRAASLAPSRGTHMRGKIGRIGGAGGVGLAMKLHRLVMIVVWLCAGAAAATGAEPEATLRVGTSGDYAPFSVSHEDGYRGFDIAVAKAFAAERELRIEWVPFEWPKLRADLLAGRFDVAMSGVTVRPERSLAGSFSIPVAASGAVALVPEDGPHQTLEQLDAPSVRIAVNQGGHLERVTRARFPAARVVAIPDNAAVPEALSRGDVHAVVSDDLEAPHWERQVPGLRRLGPFTRDTKAYLVAADRRDVAGNLDAWLLEREADGTLQRLRSEHLGRPAAEPPAAPLPALIRSMQERLALMPAVAEAKRGSGTAVRAPAQEERVIEAAQSASWAAAAVAGLPVPDAEGVRRLFLAQMAAARGIQESTLAGEPRPGTPDASLEELRSALARIGIRVAGLLPYLPFELDPDATRARIDAGLAVPGLTDEHRAAITAALVDLASAPRSEP